MRWNAENPNTQTLLDEMAKVLPSMRSMLRDYHVILAIETHFEFTTHELLRLFERCEAEPGDYLGICLDTMNLLTMLEDPEMATERILPWVVSTHIKDGGLLTGSDGLISFPTAIGEGIVPIAGIIKRLQTLSWEVNLSIEGHGGEFVIPIYNTQFLSEFPDLSVLELSQLIRLISRTTALVERGKCNRTNRDEWPGISESRLKQDIDTLKSMV